MPTQTQSSANAEKDPGTFDENPGSTENTGQDPDNDVSPEELALLDKAENNELPGDDDSLLDDSLPDDTDEDGDELNESTDLTGDDLDIPGSEADDIDEDMGEEDEENNSYSTSDQDDDEADDDALETDGSH